MAVEFVKQYGQYLEDCLDTYEALKAKTCPAEDVEYVFWNQRNNPKFYAEIIFPVFKDCDVKFIEFSYENPDKIIKENELYWTIAFSKKDFLGVKEWFIANTDLYFSIDRTYSNYDLMRILVNDILVMLYSDKVEDLRICLDESSKQCEEDEVVFNYTNPPSSFSYDGNWTFNEV